MTNYSQEHLTNLLTTDREKLTRICAEVCMGYELMIDRHCEEDWGWYLNDSRVLFLDEWQPTDDTEKGRSQAFELAVRFDCFPVKLGIEWFINNLSADFEIIHKDPQAAIIIAAILTAQQENNDE